MIYSFRIILPNIYNNRGNSINRLCNINDGEQKKYLRQAVFALYGRKKKEIGDKSNNNVTPPSLPKKTKKIPTPASSSSSSGDEALASSNKTKKIVNAEDNINQEAVIDDESMTLDPDLALLEASLRDLDMFMSVSAGDPALILDGSEPSDEDMAAIDNAFRNLGGVDLTSIFENPELTGADLGSTNNGKKKSIKKSGVADMSRAVKPQTAGTFDDDDEFASFGFEEILEGEGVNFSDLASASLPFDDSSDIALPESPREKNGPISKSVKSVVSDSTTNRPSGTFSSKQRAEAQASATAATRAASAKRKKELIAAGLSKEQAVLAVKREQEAAVGQPVTDSSDKIFMDGQEIDSKDSQQGVSPPPLEEFRRLMDSLSTESMFESGGDGWMPSERGVPLSDIISRAERADAKLKEYK